MNASIPVESNLDDLLRYVSSRWLTLAICTFVGLGLGLAAAFLPKPQYRAQVILAPAHDDVLGAGLASLAGGVGGLASLVGLSPGTGTRQNEAVLIMKSRSFAEEFIKVNQLMPVLYADFWDPATKSWTGKYATTPPSTQKAADRLVNDLIRVEQDAKTGMVRLSFVWSDPQVAADLVNKYAAKVNELVRTRELAETAESLAYLAREIRESQVLDTQAVLYRLTEAQLQRATIATVRRDFVFRIIDAARPPELDDIFRPQRVLLISISALAGLLSGVLWVMMRMPRSRAT